MQTPEKVNYNETSNNIDPDFEKWCDEIQGLDDRTISLRIRDKVLESNELDTKSKQFFKDTYDYVAKVLNQHKPFEVNLLRIYLSDVKGYDLEQYSITTALYLCAMCGLAIKIN